MFVILNFNEFTKMCGSCVTLEISAPTARQFYSSLFSPNRRPFRVSRPICSSGLVPIPTFDPPDWVFIPNSFMNSATVDVFKGHSRDLYDN